MDDTTQIQLHDPAGALGTSENDQLRRRLAFCSGPVEVSVGRDGPGWRVRASTRIGGSGRQFIAHATELRAASAIETCAQRLRAQLRSHHDRAAHHAATPMREAGA